MQLVLLMYNVYPYFSLKNLGKKVCIIYSKIRYSSSTLAKSGKSPHLKVCVANHICKVPFDM